MSNYFVPNPFERFSDANDIAKSLVNFKPEASYHYADRQYELILESIAKFESSLDDSLEVAVQLASFGQSILMQVTDISYSNPSLIRFYGFVNGVKSELIQHVSQINFLLTSVPKSDPDKPAKRIGFNQDQD